MTVFLVQHIYPMPEKFREPTIHSSREKAEDAVGKSDWVQVAPGEWFVFHKHDQGRCAIVYRVEEKTVCS